MFDLNKFLPILFGLYEDMYRAGVYDEDNLKYFVQIGTLSQAGYQTITGKKYDVEVSNNDAPEVKK
mgnify:FL=1